jgi:hypothetical protein
MDIREEIFSYPSEEEKLEKGDRVLVYVTNYIYNSLYPRVITITRFPYYGGAACHGFKVKTLK